MIILRFQCSLHRFNTPCSRCRKRPQKITEPSSCFTVATCSFPGKVHFVWADVTQFSLICFVNVHFGKLESCFLWFASFLVVYSGSTAMRGTITHRFTLTLEFTSNSFESYFIHIMHLFTLTFFMFSPSALPREVGCSPVDLNLWICTHYDMNNMSNRSHEHQTAWRWSNSFCMLSNNCLSNLLKQVSL